MKSYILVFTICLLCISNGMAQNDKYRVYSIDGNFSVSSSGSANYSIPIKVLKGLRNMTPQISINYDSNAGNGLLGWGWNIGGISTVNLTTTNTYYDGVTKGSAYTLDGKRLIETGYLTHFYKFESDDFTTVKHFWGVPESQYFEMTTQDGTKYRYQDKISTEEYGYEINMVYLLNYVEDEYGNYITYTYEHDKENKYSYLTQIKYGSNINNENEPNTINFTYETRTDPIPFVHYTTHERYNGSGKITKRLTSIKSGGWIYRFEYDNDNRATLLTKISESGNSSYNRPTIIKWDKRENRLLNINDTDLKTDAFMTDSKDMMFYSVDLNGDGVSDIVSVFPNKMPDGNGQVTLLSHIIRYISEKKDNSIKFTHGGRQIFRNIDIGMFNDLSKTKNGPFVNVHLKSGNKQQLMYSEYERYSNGTKFIRFHIFNETNGIPRVIEQVLNTATELPLFSSVDLDNIGVDKIVCLEKQACGDNYYQGYIITVTGEKNNYELIYNTIPFKLELRSKPLRLIPGDFNGDGLVDLLILLEDGCYIFLNQGSQNKYFDRSFLNLSNTSFNGKYYTVESGDFNGDGLTDLILKEKYNSAYKLAINYGRNVGSNWESTFKIRTLTNVTISNDRSNEEYKSSLVYDFDNDGRSDLLLSGTSGSSCIKRWYRSTGDDFELIKSVAISDKELISAKFKNNLLGDFDGDGRPDLMTYGPQIYQHGTGNMGNTPIKWRFYTDGANDIARLGRVSKITDGYRRSVDIKYSNFSDISANYDVTINSQYPVMDIISMPMGLVDRVTYNDATGTEQIFTDYKYSGAKVHLQGKGFLGFSNISTTSGYYDNNNNYKKNSTVTQSFGLNTTYYVPYLIEQIQKKGDLLTSSTNSIYEFEDLGKKRFNILLKTQVSKDYINGNTTTTNYSEFYKGKPKTTSIDYGSNIKVESKIEYNEKGFPTKIVKTQKEGTNSWTEQTELEYQSQTSSDVKKKTNYVNGNYKVSTTKYEYDIWGNTVEETINNYDSDNFFTTEYGYTADGKHLESKIFPDGQILTYFYNSFDDKLAYTEDYHSGEGTNISTYRHSLIKRRSVKNKYGVSETKSEEYPVTFNRPTGPYNSLYTVTENGDNIPTTVSHYDGWGREIKTSQTRFDGSKIFTAKVYNREGQLIKESLPYKSQPSGWNNYSYDSYGLLKEFKHASGRIESYSYGSNTKKTIKDGITVTKTFDPIGRLKKVVDPVSEITYEYRADGQLSKIRTKEGIETSFTYDKYGRQESIKDPSGGDRKYSYDKDGNIASITDAEKNVKTMQYDKFGRILTKIENDITTNYNYHPVLGDIVLIASSTGHKIEYSYGDKRRLLTEKESFEGNVFEKSYTYSDNELLLSTKYSVTGKDIATLNYQYTTNGDLTKITLNGGTEIWSLKAENQLGLPTLTKVGSLDRIHEYDSHGVLISQKLRNSNGIIQDYGYVFNKTKEISIVGQTNPELKLKISAMTG